MPRSGRPPDWHTARHRRSTRWLGLVMDQSLVALGLALIATGAATRFAVWAGVGAIRCVCELRPMARVEDTMLSTGDPRTFAPDLYNGMTRLERRQIANAYEGRVLLQGQGKRYYPDDEPPESVAKRSFQSGMATTSLVLSAPFIMVCAGAISFLNAGDRNATTISIAGASGVVVALVLGFWLVRLRQIRRYFATSPAVDDVEAQAAISMVGHVGSDGDETDLGSQAGERPAMPNGDLGRVLGVWLAALAIWVAWSFVRFSVLIPVAMTVAAAAVSVTTIASTRRRRSRR